MPQTKQAKKELRKGAKRAASNLKIKEDLKTLIKKTRKAIDDKDSKAQDMLKKVQKSIDKAVQKKVIKKNTGSRKLSRLMIYFKRGGEENQTKEKTAKEAK